MAKKYFTDESLATFVNETKAYTDDLAVQVAYIDETDTENIPDDGGYVTRSDLNVLMSTTVKTGWLKDNEGNKFAPKTTASQVVREDGTTLAELSWNDLQDKPFYEAEPVETVIVPETTFTGTSKVISVDTPGLTVGQTYTVIFDDATYENLVCQMVSGLPAIGSLDFSYSDYPFLIGIDNGSGNCNLMASTNASHTVKVTGMVSEVIQLDRKYIAEHIDDFAGKKVDDVAGAEIFNDYNNNVARGTYSHAEGRSTIAYGLASHSEGSKTSTMGQGSHAEGNSSNALPDSITPDSSVSAVQTAWDSAKFTLARGIASHAEGSNTLALSAADHSEGYETIAKGGYSHAQGYKSQATGSRAHAEGNGSVASGNDSHAEGTYTIAAGESQHVQGKYNVEDIAGTYAHIVGNGSSASNRKNAHTLDWNGNAWYAGNLTTGGKTTATDGLPGCFLDTSGILCLQGSGVSPNQIHPQVRFFETDAVSYANRIYSSSDYMYFEGAQGYEFDENVRSTARFYSGGKRTQTDGLGGCILNTGYIDICGAGDSATVSAPSLRFWQNGNTDIYDARIYLSSSDIMTFTGGTSYSFDSAMRVGGQLNTTGAVVAGNSVCAIKSSASDGKEGTLVGSNGRIYIQKTDEPAIYFYTAAKTASNGRLGMNTDDYMYFENAARYVFDKAIYINSSAVSTSDRNKKKDFAEFDERYENLFFDLKPQIYKFKDGESDRFHSGFISQDVEESMFRNGLDSKDFAGYCKEIQRRSVAISDDETVREDVYDENGNPVYDYMLRYEEFIALNTHMLQKAYAQINEMADTIKELKQEIELLKVKQ